MEDKESGIKEIHYVVSDVTLGTQVGNGTIKGQMDGERRTKRVSVIKWEVAMSVPLSATWQTSVYLHNTDITLIIQSHLYMY